MTLKALKAKADEYAGLETIAVPASITRLHYRSSELTAVCPVTNQPDFYAVDVALIPAGQGIESKSLKLYLRTFDGQGVFCEVLADRIAQDVQAASMAQRVTVTLTQAVRGGIEIVAQAEIEMREQDA